MASETSPLPRLVGISRFGIAAEVQEAAAAASAAQAPPVPQARCCLLRSRRQRPLQAQQRLSVDVDTLLSPPPRASKPELDTRFDLVVLVSLHLSP
jgi:hypothetical protein